MSNFAFIFARGGSKGLPRKNVRRLAGKPLIQYSIETAQSVESIEKVFVSTEDSEIAEIARNAGAIVIDRPAELASDTSPEWLSWQHAIEWATERFGKFEQFISLPATSPLRSVGDVELAIEKQTSKESDICISITPASRSPFFNMVKVYDNGLVGLVNKPEKGVARRQDAPTVYDITTVVYVASTSFILNHSSIFEGKVTAVEVPKERAIDIDDIFDFKLAEIIVEEGISG
ncbi:cytidylyltransferase domain-containing protein [Pseudoalteromonas obscura]|uniref:Acylneuraminate cytidylyltransferase family protein n=1 Tax=Pseudoalteromonas obscura TaxID=3048491 RepID=A0ABT7ER93_9GAMM|nr:acylneuraminate cytidylyltransferase family protein [Pseudoalteromonas sp. P94(2023)]MDK2597586.1 acylneuraminate cytidylyltransferase family protein [Pseudoalteromonas sp. P94(2023)]